MAVAFVAASPVLVDVLDVIRVGPFAGRRGRPPKMTPRQRQVAIQRLAEWTEEQARHG